MTTTAIYSAKKKRIEMNDNSNEGKLESDKGIETERWSIMMVYIKIDE